jgi:hypothetical protein
LSEASYFREARKSISTAFVNGKAGNAQHKGTINHRRPPSEFHP